MICTLTLVTNSLLYEDKNLDFLHTHARLLPAPPSSISPSLQLSSPFRPFRPFIPPSSPYSVRRVLTLTPILHWLLSSSSPPGSSCELPIPLQYLSFTIRLGPVQCSNSWIPLGLNCISLLLVPFFVLS